MVVASTASPYKFAVDVYESLTDKRTSDDLEALAALSEYSNTEITYPLRDLDKREVRFTQTIEADDMLSEVYNYINK